MTRTTKHELQLLVDMINRRLGLNDDQAFTLGYAYGGVRVERARGSVDVSPRGTKAETASYLHAFLDGVDHARLKVEGK